ncbi:MAG TPA: DPP IV N-terminal domain-containing protein [Candidatus Sulfotelmatobacter sp.]|nr:DPP IV N-terminal domain-containing protein [Candidatus Sulfotelmatobacter sp.]
MLVRLVVALLAVASVLGWSAPPAFAGEQLTVDDVAGLVPATGRPPNGFTWAPDGSRYVYTVPATRPHAPPQLWLHDLRDGSDRPLFAARSSQRGSRSRAIGQIVWSPDARRIAYVDGDALDVADAAGGHPHVLAHGADDPQWSPDGSRVAFVHDGDLEIVRLADGRTTRLTRDGSASVLNGDPDWLYSEEMDVSHAYAWSPDGTRIAFLRFDDTPVTDYPIQQYLDVPDNSVEHQRYPLAGEKNPHVSLRVVAAGGGAVRTLYDGAPRDEYLVSFAWTPNGHAVVDEILDRAQQHLRLTAFPAGGGVPRTLLRESDAHFLEVAPAPQFLRDGRRFLWISTRSGVAGLWLIDARNGAARLLTGTTPVGDVAQLDEAHGAVYVDALAPTRRDHALLRFPLGRGAPADLTPEPGAHAVVMPPRGRTFIDTWSALGQPPVVYRRTIGGGKAVVFTSRSLARFDLGAPRLLQIPSAHGPLDAWMIVPPGFDPSRRYPVIVTVYGGPLPVSWGVPSDDRWPGLFDQLLAERGFIVFTVDGPASRNDRSANAALFSHRMGTIAIAGPLAGAAWLRRQPFVDPARLGLYGWSYGGYLTAYTVTHAPGVFHSAIAGAPPSDWRFYDSAYTERYLGMPKAQAAVYDRAAVLPAAGRLQSALLVIQGASDDNVHLMNSQTLLAAFMRSGKVVDYRVVPGMRHGPSGVDQTRYVDATMLAWWERTLR